LALPLALIHPSAWYLTDAGEETFRVTVAGINEMQRRPQLPDQTS
jgi:hypothetical protein